MGWVKPPQPRARARRIGRRDRRRPGRPRGRRPAAQARLPDPRLRPLRPGRRPADLRHPQLQAREGRWCSGAPTLLAEGGIRFHLDCEVGSAACASTSCARATMRCSSAPASTGRATSRCPGVGLANIVPALDYLIASNRKGLGDAVPAFDSGALERRRQAGRGDRRRRHRDGLRAHRGAPGRRLGAAASTAATAPTCRARCAR